LLSTAPARMTVLDGGPWLSEPPLVVSGSHWSIKNLMLQTGEHGVVFDGASDIEFSENVIYSSGKECVMLVNKSTFVTITKSEVQMCGMLDFTRGDGVVVGTASSDRCHNNTLSATKFDQVRSRSIVLALGSDFAIVTGNSFTASGMAQSGFWVDIRSSFNTVSSNVGTNVDDNKVLVDGIRIQGGSGNVVDHNRLNLKAKGYGILVTAGAHTICASNEVVNAAMGTTNVVQDWTC
jgi:hypothetical protein